ncbi:hypothetical protein HMN09_01240400 [Mycena chlorophos]|uniref:Uncharacterized protein n=1 Tax=Mycena chlorophos TaxID=658473 RepID=A0A8H6S3T2_MYCCL|nr:hypothetical protein HMN09_01240400 [Mycena chlorophos]
MLILFAPFKPTPGEPALKTPLRNPHWAYASPNQQPSNSRRRLTRTNQPAAFKTTLQVCAVVVVELGAFKLHLAPLRFAFKWVIVCSPLVIGTNAASRAFKSHPRGLGHRRAGEDGSAQRSLAGLPGMCRLALVSPSDSLLKTRKSLAIPEQTEAGLTSVHNPHSVSRRLQTPLQIQPRTPLPARAYFKFAMSLAPTSEFHLKSTPVVVVKLAPEN